MRNWNNKKRKDLIRLILRFHFTYEELKSIFGYNSYKVLKGFHFTYEELKYPMPRFIATKSAFRFHFTYEELKYSRGLFYVCFSRMFPLYLWGIEILWGFVFVGLLSGVSTLPMRNWNLCLDPKYKVLAISFHFTYEELKYLAVGRAVHKGFGFHFTYEELKSG